MIISTNKFARNTCILHTHKLCFLKASTIANLKMGGWGCGSQNETLNAALRRCEQNTFKVCECT